MAVQTYIQQLYMSPSEHFCLIEFLYSAYFKPEDTLTGRTDGWIENKSYDKCIDVGYYFSGEGLL